MGQSKTDNFICFDTESVLKVTFVSVLPAVERYCRCFSIKVLEMILQVSF